MRQVVLSLMLLLCPVSALGAESAPDSTSLDEVLVLPFANYTGRYEALETVLPVFYAQLDSFGLRVLDHQSLRPILREHRVRVIGRISREGMDVLAEATGARYAIVGSVDIYEPERTFEVMISARLVDLHEHRVLTALSLGRTVQETERIFGLGRAEEIAAIIPGVVEELVGAISGRLAVSDEYRRRYHMCGMVAVVPMDDYSARRHGAAVLQNILMAELVAKDWSVVEPGIVQGVLLDAGRMARGGVAHQELQVLRERVGVCFVVTGELEEFSLTRSDLDVSVPRLGFGLRLVDAREHRLVATIDQSRDGAEGETLFGMGREHSMAALARRSMADVVDWIAEEGDR